MKSMRKLLYLTIFSLLYCIPSYGELIPKSHFYPKTALPGQTVRFTARIFNNGINNAQFYASVVLTAQATRSFELYEPGFPAPTYELLPGANGSFTFTVRVPDEEGVYSVSIILYNFADVRILTIYGSFPLTIGNPTQGISAHPSNINFGKLHEGRFMYPIPIKVRYKIFIPNKLGDIQPWALRLYTDNANKFKGIKGAVRQLPPGGLLHSSGKYTIPLKFWNLNWGPEVHSSGWDGAIQGPPPVEKDIFWKGVLLDESTPDNPVHDHDRKPWLRIPDYAEMSVDPHSWRRAVGQYPYDGQFVNPTNPGGDYTLSLQPEPFELYFAIEINSTSVRGKYSGRVVLELFSP
ncbi:MAG: hypothetical protein RBU23_10870 [Candidatus Auribacterota bacterium]|jgi:hypothetical protein|nr:hypothetical protein [Candidatus Auribacterota bacterium]